MQRNSLDSFIYFGTAFRYLQDLRPHPDARLIGGPLDNINSVLDFLEANNMRVSVNAAWELRAFRDRIEERGLDDCYLDEANCTELNEVMRRLRPTILAESQEVTAFFPREKRYNIDKLYDDISGIVGQETFDLLPEASQQDFEEAGKCILLERGTAASFHLMRGCECALKQLYRSVIKRGRKENPTWGSMTAHLNERNELSDSLKGTLDNFRRGFRNPTAHPETFYSTDDAQDLLGTSTQLVSLLVHHSKYERESK